MKHLIIKLRIAQLAAIEAALKVLSCIDPVIDYINLRRMGYKRILFVWTYIETGNTFSTRREAVSHMNSMLADKAIKRALATTHFSAKSRNADCLCGSGLKYKKCCYKLLQ